MAGTLAIIPSTRPGPRSASTAPATPAAVAATAVFLLIGLTKYIQVGLTVCQLSSCCNHIANGLNVAPAPTVNAALILTFKGDPHPNSLAPAQGFTVNLQGIGLIEQGLNQKADESFKIRHANVYLE